MTGLTSPVWTIGMFQMVSGESCQCMKRTKQRTGQPDESSVSNNDCFVDLIVLIVVFLLLITFERV
jgi:hypothetical protein